MSDEAPIEPKTAYVKVIIHEDGRFDFDWDREKIHVMSIPLILKKAAQILEKNLLSN